MKILILTEGTRGDVQPCLALAQAVTAVGHQATVVGWTRWPSPYISESRVNFTPVGRDNELKPMGTVASRLTLGGIRGMVARVQLAHQIRPVIPAVLDEIWATAGDSDLVVHLPGIMAGQHIAEKLGVPAVVLTFAPMYVPTGDMANPLLRYRAPAPRTLNRASYAITPLLWLLLRRPTRAWREQSLGLPWRRRGHDPLCRPGGGPAPVLGAYSRHVISEPSDARNHVEVTGFWLSSAPEDWLPPPELADFIGRGDPPVYVGFGSMPVDARDQAWRTVLDAIEQARVRAVITVGWSGSAIGDAGDNVHITDEVPHGWLFPLVAAVVHHGGAGTTGAALAAGRPQVICPCFLDQPFWADKMRQLGVASSATPLRKHTTATLAAAIRKAVSDHGLRRQAEIIGQAVRAENGAESAVKFLEKIHKEPQS